MPTRKTASGEQAAAEDDTTAAAALMNYLALLPNKDIGSQNYIYTKKKNPSKYLGPAKVKPRREGFSLSGENDLVYTAYTHVCIPLTVGASSLQSNLTM